MRKGEDSREVEFETRSDARWYLLAVALHQGVILCVLLFALVASALAEVSEVAVGVVASIGAGLAFVVAPLIATLSGLPPMDGGQTKGIATYIWRFWGRQPFRAAGERAGLRPGWLFVRPLVAATVVTLLLVLLWVFAEPRYP